MDKISTQFETRQQSRDSEAGVPSSEHVEAPTRSKSKQRLRRRDKAIETFTGFAKEKLGSSLKAWIKVFDVNNDGVVTRHEFGRGMVELGWEGGDTSELFDQLDWDASGDLTLSDFDVHHSVLWKKFREWCSSNFESPGDFLASFGAKLSGSSFEAVTKEQFLTGLVDHGWDGSFNEEIYAALESSDDKPGISVEDMQWLDMELKRLRRQAIARSKFHNEKDKMQQTHRGADQVLQKFKKFLKRKYGGYVRAWRSGLTSNDSMVLPKAQFIIGCQNAGWKEQPGLLFQAFDKDGSGEAGIEELDLREVENMARFCFFIKDQFGSGKEAFRALDKDGVKSLKYEKFAEQLKRYGYNLPSKQLFHGLDKDNMRALNEEHFLFLDHWKPLPYLGKAPNKKAADDIKALLARRYKNLMKAWLTLLDPNSSNTCNWYEFQAACEKARYNGDVAGAWRAFDDDLSGFITLREIDEKSYESLMEFKRWADSEFGCARAAFDCFDADHSNSVSSREFLRSCRIYTFPGDTSAVKAIFNALDKNETRSLCSADVAFLDTWVLEDENETTGNGEGAFKRSISIHEGASQSNEGSSPRAKVSPRLTRRMESLARPRGIDYAVASPTPCSEWQDNGRKSPSDPLHMYRGALGSPNEKQTARSNSPSHEPQPAVVFDPARDIKMRQDLLSVGKRVCAACDQYRNIHNVSYTINEICDQILLNRSESDDGLVALELLDVALRGRLKAELSLADLNLLWDYLDSEGSGEVGIWKVRRALYAMEMSRWCDLPKDALSSLVLSIDHAAQKSCYGTKVKWLYLVGTVDNAGNTQVAYDNLIEFLHGLSTLRSANGDEVTEKELQGLWKAVDTSCEMKVLGHKFMQFMRRHGARLHAQNKDKGQIAATPRELQSVATAPKLSDGALGNLAAQFAMLLRFWIGHKGCGSSDAGMVITPQSLSHIFDTVDIEGYGSVSLVVLNAVLQSSSQFAGITFSENGLKSLWRCLDSKKIGSVSASEFCSALYSWQLLTWPKLDRAALGKIVQLLNRVANKYHRTNGKGWYKVLMKCHVDTLGVVDFNFLHGMVRGLLPGLSLSPKELSNSDLQGLWKAIDADAVGSISVDTFLRFMNIQSQSQAKVLQSFPVLTKQQVAPVEQVFTKLWKALDRL